MAPKTIKSALADMLEDLTKEDFDKFCHRLLDRREEPRVKRSKVEDKKRLDIANELVKTFTEAKSLQVALEILREIGCNEDAERLDSKTKHFGDNGDPTFRKTSDGVLDINPSQEALKYAAGRWPLRAARRGDPPVKKPEEVEDEAKAPVLSEGGDPLNDRLVLSRYIIQFGKYQGQTFKWLLENDVRYTAMQVASHQKEREHSTRQNPLMANKDSLTRYSIAYPDVLKEVKFHHAYDRAKERSLQPGQEGKALVGFGRYRSETLQDLYDSKDKEIISYVNFLRDKKSTCDPGSRMECAIGYILQRDQEKAAAANRPTVNFAPHAARKRKTRSKQVQSTRGQSTSASRPVKGKLKRSLKKTRFCPLSRY